MDREILKMSDSKIDEEIKKEKSYSSRYFELKNEQEDREVN